MHFACVENIMETEAYAKANGVLNDLKQRSQAKFGLNADCRIEKGKKYDKIVDLV